MAAVSRLPTIGATMMSSPRNILEKLRSDALSILHACLEAADPEKAVKRFVTLEGEDLVINGDFRVSVADPARIFIVGAGKASAPMAKALEDVLGDRIKDGLVCVKYGHGLDLNKVKVREASHPVPDKAGEDAGREISALLQAAGPKDLVLACMSGGGSALLPGPPQGITLEGKQALTRTLLAVGANIHEINVVRKHLSLTKGGNLMRVSHPALVVNLMLSDVIGDDPGTIASGPFASDSSTFEEALAILDRYGLTDSAPPEVSRRLRAGAKGDIPENPKPGDSIFGRVKNVLVGSNILSLNAGRQKAVELGYNALILSSSIEGDTGEAAGLHCALAREVRSTGNPIAAPACLLSGGETTVVVRGQGLGGRNQEFALSVVREAARIRDSLFLSAGTDGTDGPTDAAGAIADTDTLERAIRRGLNPEAFLENNDSYHFFEKLGNLVVTGPTRTNVMDVRIVLLAT
jgi:glycerate 2-kinase